MDPACGRGALLIAALEMLEADSEDSRGRLHGIEIDPELARFASRALARAGAASIRTGDALGRAARWPAGTCVLANPPWLSFSGRHAAAPPPEGIETRPGWPSLHGAFLERIALHVAREGTVAGVLVPASLAESERYGPCRAAVAYRARLLEPPLELGERAFPGVVEPALLLLLGPADPAAAAGPAPWTGPDPDQLRLLELFERFPRLPAGSFADPGVHTGNAAPKLLREAPGPSLAGLRRGRDLTPYALESPSQFLRTDLEPGAGLRFRRGPLERYRGYPALLRQTADRPIAALHVDPGYFRNSLLACRPVPGLDPAFVVAVLNSPVASFWHRAKHRDARQRSFPQVKVSHLAAQPFPFAHRARSPTLHDEIAARVRALDPRASAFDAAGRRIEELVLSAFGLSLAAAEALKCLAGR